MTRKKNSTVNKWVTITIGKIIRESIKKFISRTFGKRSCFTKSSKQDGCYLVLLKVQYTIAISEFIEKLCHLIIAQKAKNNFKI